MSLCFAPVETERLLLRRMEPGDPRLHPRGPY